MVKKNYRIVLYLFDRDFINTCPSLSNDYFVPDIFGGNNNYSQDLFVCVYWFQQLFAESLGKKNKGFLTVISNDPKDHHSLLQLYLDGPKDKIFYIFDIKDKNGINVSLSMVMYKLKVGLFSA